MAQLSSYSMNYVADWCTGKASMPSATTYYLGLWNGNPQSGGTEITSTVATGGRVALASMSTSSGGANSSTNSSAIVWTTSAIGSGTLTYITAHDASTAGNLIWLKPVTSASINLGNNVQIAASGLTVTSGSSASPYTKDYIVNWMTGTASMPATSTRYLALFNGDPTGAGVEVTRTVRGAGRLAITSLMGAASYGLATNSSQISFGNSAGLAQVSHDATYDSVVAGNLIYSSALTYGIQTVNVGYPVNYAVGAFTVQAS